ncbi:hypothetical protein DFH09DRAFT_1089180 [Mycena vulgaris]|nr:hypothetical protein DFH09DRAFT_1089180 [Mycena vulgaris]
MRQCSSTTSNRYGRRHTGTTSEAAYEHYLHDYERRHTDTTSEAAYEHDLHEYERRHTGTTSKAAYEHNLKHTGATSRSRGTSTARKGAKERERARRSRGLSASIERCTNMITRERHLDERHKHDLGGVVMRNEPPMSYGHEHHSNQEKKYRNVGLRARRSRQLTKDSVDGSEEAMHACWESKQLNWEGLGCEKEDDTGAAVLWEQRNLEEPRRRVNSRERHMNGCCTISAENRPKKVYGGPVPLAGSRDGETGSSGGTGAVDRLRRRQGAMKRA